MYESVSAKVIRSSLLHSCRTVATGGEFQKRPACARHPRGIDTFRTHERTFVEMQIKINQA
jgi:hypothetical protein